MKAIISTNLIGKTFKINLFPSSDTDKNERRHQRVKTLDGGVAYENRGLFSADKEMQLITEYNSEIIEQLKNHPLWVVSVKDGAYVCICTDWKAETNGLKMNFKGVK